MAMHALMQWLGLRPLPVSREQAVEIATRHVIENELGGVSDDGFGPPTAARSGLRWHVLMDPGWRPTRVVIMDGRTGMVIRFCNPPR